MQQQCYTCRLKPACTCHIWNLISLSKTLWMWIEINQWVCIQRRIGRLASFILAIVGHLNYVTEIIAGVSQAIFSSHPVIALDLSILSGYSCWGCLWPCWFCLSMVFITARYPVCSWNRCISRRPRPALPDHPPNTSHALTCRSRKPSSPQLQQVFEFGSPGE